MQKHVNLNYLFTWTESEKTPDVGDNALLSLSLDSWNVGNETRYLNHEGEKTNCQAMSEFWILYKYYPFEGWGPDRHSLPRQWEL